MASSVDDEERNTEKIPMTEENCNRRRTMSNGDDMIPQKARPTLAQILYDFTQHTTLHGVRLILMERVGIVRRILWFLGFLICTVLMFAQIGERLFHYYRYPVAIDYSINFNKMLAFPTVTICNQNTFRATSASRRNWYRLVGELYPNKLKSDEETAEAYNTSRLFLDDMYLDTAHKKEDLIVACEWENEECGPHNFTEVLTDQGVCYSFNDNMLSPLFSSRTGPGSGLKLTLNVEQYDYIPKAETAAGVKLLLHDREEIPRVAELGFAVATGTHTFVGVQLMAVKNLPKPHGTCLSEPSPFFKKYSPNACQLACMTKFVDSLCGCRHIYMPHNEGNPVVCSLEGYISCLGHGMASVNEFVRDKCKCPAPCDYVLYSPLISYASISTFTMNKLLAPASVSPLRRRYLQARETTTRMDNTNFRHFTQLTSELRVSFRDLQAAFSKGVQNGLLNQHVILKTISNDMKHVWDQKKYLLEWQTFHVETNFVSFKDDAEERIFFYLTFANQEFVYQIASRIKQIATDVLNVTMTDATRSALYIEVLQMINGRIDLVDKAYDSYQQLQNSYRNGEPIFASGFREEPIEDNLYITPRALLNYSISISDSVTNETISLGEDIEYMKAILLDYVTLAKTSFYDRSVNNEELGEIGIQFLNWETRFNQSKMVFYSDIVEHPLNIMKQKLIDFDQIWKDFDRNYHLMADKIELLLDKLNTIQKNDFSILDQNIAKAEWYISFNNITRLQVADVFASEQLQKNINEIREFANEVRSGGLKIYDGWTALNQSSNSIWSMILEDENLHDYYKYQNVTELLVPFSQISELVSRNYLRYRDSNNFLNVLGNHDNFLLRHLDKMVAEMKDVIDDSVLDTEFLKNNFLQLDVFHNEKGYEQVTQQATYNVFALFCDIGGTMALFLGASVLTLCELLDLGLHHAIYKLTHSDGIQ